MKKTFFTIVIALSALITQAQVVTSNPAFITQENAGVVEIIFDASQGSGGLKDYTGDVYAHTGVITAESTSDADWKHAPTKWGDNNAKYKLSSLGNNKYKLLLTPSLQEYYELDPGEKVLKLAFVFRNDTGSKEGKDIGGKDILVTVYETGLNVAFTNPSISQAVTKGTTMDIQFETSMAADLNLLINGNSVKSTSGATSLSYSYTFSNATDYMLVAEAGLSGKKTFDTLYICVPAPVVSESRPANVKDGINYINDKTVTLVMYAPKKSNIFVIGDFNDWLQLNAYQMKKDGDYWWITINDLTPGELYGFQYLVDSSLRISDAYTELVLDPWNDKWINEKYLIYPDLKPYPEGKTEGLVSTLQTAKPAYQWQITDFKMPDRENMIIYELLLRDFTTEKSLQAAFDKLDYLERLGINAIELMPIQEFDGNNSWGYNPNHFFAPDKAYGTPEMYKKFIDECHKRGIAVLLDVVFNHATGINPFAKLYWNGATSETAADNPWFNVKATHPFNVFHDFNHEFAGTREYFKRVLQYWIQEYKVDGYRLDLTKGFTQKQSTESTASRYDQSRIDILTDYYNATKAVKSDVMFILEHFCDDDEELVLANKGMYLWRNVNNAFSQAAMGYQSESDFRRMNTTPRRFVGFAESHDEERNFYKVKAFGSGTLKTDESARMKRIPLNIAFTTLIPGPKMIWQFGELGYDYSIEYNGGRTSEKPSAFTLNWLNNPERKAAYDASSLIINLRKEYQKAFSSGNFEYNIATSDWTQGRRIGLTHNDLDMVALGNFQSSSTITASPKFSKTGIWYELLTGTELTVSNVNMTIDMEPGKVLIYTNKKFDLPNSIEKPNIAQDCIVYPSMTKDKVYISTTGFVSAVSVYNMQGALLQSNAGEISDLDLSGYPSGLYLIDIQTSTGRSIHKVIKN